MKEMKSSLASHGQVRLWWKDLAGNNKQVNVAFAKKPMEIGLLFINALSNSHM